MQPGASDGGGSGDKFAELLRFAPIRIGRNRSNSVDAAVGRVLDPQNTQNVICGIGAVTGAQNGVEGQRVRMHGRTTGLSQGRIDDDSVDALVGMDHRDPSVVACFADQLRIKPIPGSQTFGLGGDSGSLVVDAEEQIAAGLYFAGPEDGSYALANPIWNVLDELEIEIL